MTNLGQLEHVSEDDYAALGRHLIGLITVSNQMGHANPANTVQYIEAPADDWRAQLVLHAFGATRPVADEDRAALRAFTESPAGNAIAHQIADTST